MNRFVSPVLRLIDRVAPPETVSAHCDVPCGIYDPHSAQVAALTVLRMNQLIEALQLAGNEKGQLDTYANSLGRYISTKESHAEICKRELDILWHDYFNPTHLEKYPDIHTKFWTANKLASKNKQTVDMQAAKDLLAACRDIAEIFWASKNIPTRRAASNQTVGDELVYVDNR